MKALLKIAALLLPLLVFSQGDTLKISPETKKIATEIVSNKRAIDSMHALKEMEVKKQLKLLDLIRKKISKLKDAKKLSPKAQYEVVSALDTINGLKPETDAVYWEEVRRKWTGRVLNKSDTKIRIFRYVDGQKVYLN